MQIVIEISEEVRNTIIEHDLQGIMARAIANGKPLPKGHGRLIDADALYSEIADGTEGFDFAHWTRGDIAEAIDDAPTIIEADEDEE